jgi:predicted NAD-dependent protein-ADP-ribosyltransferase YbiA (DUF1768 family)
MKKQKSREVSFRSINDEYGWLSCMSRHPIDYNGLLFRTTEALFQWLRFDGHPEAQAEIINALSPLVAKMKAKKHNALLNREGFWDYAEDDRERMKMCFRLKLEQHPELRTKLLATRNRMIYEDCERRFKGAAKTWGAIKVKGKWIGENVFGQLWMEIRSELLA